MLPILSTAMEQPASWHQRTKRSRPSRSSSLSARRQLPPATPGPIFAISMRLSHRRSPFTFRFLRLTASIVCLLSRLLAEGIARVLGPVHVALAVVDLDHGDAALDRPHVQPEIEAAAFGVDHLVALASVLPPGLHTPV